MKDRDFVNVAGVGEDRFASAHGELFCLEPGDGQNPLEQSAEGTNVAMMPPHPARK
ncbi:MAG TPA: hypothetical protein VKB88_29785 [Bryobacteraceae bacterium]|nr:hypothetical protein [Bryobacteraceae bacterium]